MTRQEHWNEIYRTKDTDDVSWYQSRPDRSLALIKASGTSKDAGIIDIGAGESTLVDFLLKDGYTHLGVLDVSGVALKQGRARLGDMAGEVEWFEADVTSFVPPHRFGLWHDRAVVHFLTAAEDRRTYVETVKRTLRPGDMRSLPLLQKTARKSAVALTLGGTTKILSRLSWAPGLIFRTYPGRITSRRGSPHNTTSIFAFNGNHERG